MSLSDITFSPEVKREVRKRYKEQMKKWSPRRVQSNASPVNKAIAAMLTEIWEKKSREPPKPTMRRLRGRQGGYGLYDLRVLRLFGGWIDQIESQEEAQEEQQCWRVTACYLDIIRAKDADEAARFFRAMHPILESDWMSLSVDKEAAEDDS